jgi:glycosyltransferase involved in cell wall biosynthesis
LYSAAVGYFRWLHNQATLNLCPSHATLRELQTQGYKQLQVWGRGVDSQRFHPARRTDDWRRRLSGGESERPLLLYVGRLSLEKRVDWLQPLLHAVPAARLAIVGDGPLRPTLEQTFAGLPVCFTGYLTGGDLAAAYAAADVFVFPAHNETFGNVVAEVMASGLPVVAARSGGVEEQIVPGVTGLHAAAGSQADFLDCAASLVRDPVWARRWPSTTSWPWSS